MIVVVGLTHRSAPLEVRERLAIPKDGLPAVLERLTSLPSVGEAVVLSTCNRVEVYATGKAKNGASDLEATASAVTEVLTALGTEIVRPHLRSARGPDAVRHLFRVAASLDSLVIGEPQILGQLKEAIEISRAEKRLGSMLGKAMHRAVRIGKRVRTETTIGEGQVSVSSIAVDLARQIFGELAGHRALLVGAGEMGEAASRLLVKEGAALSVVNRSPERAAALAKEHGGEPIRWEDLERALTNADVVVSSTASPKPILTRDLVKRVAKARKGRSLFLIDIAVPRDVEPSVNELDNVYLYDVDDLSKQVAASLQGRAAEAARAERIVADEARGFEASALEHALTPTIVGLRAKTRAVLAAEVERSLAGKLKHLTPADRSALAVMIDAATNKLLHAPVTRLKALAAEGRAGEHTEVLRELFDLPELSTEPEEEESRGGDERVRPEVEPEAAQVEQREGR